MELTGFYTERGLLLSTKIMNGTPMVITRVTAGCSQTETSADALAQEQQTLSVNSPVRSGNTITFSATMLAADASANYTLTELGVYAQDPDRGEILYKIYRPDAPISIAAGTTLVLRFYLEETLSDTVDFTVSCSPAGLVTEEQFTPLQSKVLTTEIPARAVTLAASALQAHLNDLPRLLTEHLTLHVSGTVATHLHIHSFYGPGSLTIKGDSAETFILKNGITISNCVLQIVKIQNATIQVESGSTERCVYVTYTPHAQISDCSVIGNGETAGVQAMYFGNVYLDDTNVSNTLRAIYASYTSMCSVKRGTFSNNTYGCRADGGGTVFLCDSASDLLGGVTHENAGGLIVKKDGTLL